MKLKYRVILSALSGILLTLSYPNFNLSYLAWVGLVPFFLAIRDTDPKKAFFLGFIMGITLFVTLVYWVQIFFILALPFVSIVSSTYIGLLAILINWITKKLPRWELIAVPSLWVSLEYYRTLGFLRFPWAILGYSQYQVLPIIQIASFTGVFGVSFFIALFNISLAKTIYEYPKVKFRSVKNMTLGVFLVGVSLTYGLRVIPDKPLERNVNVAMVQPYFDSWTNIYRGFGFNREEKLEILFTLSDHAINGQGVIQEGESYKDLKVLPSVLSEKGEVPDILFWTETTLPEMAFTVDKTNGGYKLIPKKDITLKIKELLEGRDTYLLVGSYMRSKKYDGRYLNSAFLLSPDGEVLDTYSKMKLVPFGESFPFYNIPSMRRLADRLNAGGFVPGDRYTVFETSKGKFSVVICYEGALGSLVRKFVDNGAEFIANISNDSWMHNRAGHYQHFSMNVFRAVENRVYFVRAGNDGVTAIIDPYGRILSTLDAFERGTLTGKVSLREGKTFYTKYGDVFVFFCIMFSFLAVGFFLGAVKK